MKFYPPLFCQQKSPNWKKVIIFNKWVPSKVTDLFSMKFLLSITILPLQDKKMLYRFCTKKIMSLCKIPT